MEVVVAVSGYEVKILADKRYYGGFKDGWEFLGGKMEDRETPQQALVREIKAELEE